MSREPCSGLMARPLCRPGRAGPGQARSPLPAFGPAAPPELGGRQVIVSGRGRMVNHHSRCPAEWGSQVPRSRGRSVAKDKRQAPDLMAAWPYATLHVRGREVRVPAAPLPADWYTGRRMRLLRPSPECLELRPAPSSRLTRGLLLPLGALLVLMTVWGLVAG